MSKDDVQFVCLVVETTAYLRCIFVRTFFLGFSFEERTAHVLTRLTGDKRITSWTASRPGRD